MRFVCQNGHVLRRDPEEMLRGKTLCTFCRKVVHIDLAPPIPTHGPHRSKSSVCSRRRSKITAGYFRRIREERAGKAGRGLNQDAVANSGKVERVAPDSQRHYAVQVHKNRDSEGQVLIPGVEDDAPATDPSVGELYSRSNPAPAPDSHQSDLFKHLSQKHRSSSVLEYRTHDPAKDVQLVPVLLSKLPADESQTSYLNGAGKAGAVGDSLSVSRIECFQGAKNPAATDNPFRFLVQRAGENNG